MKNDFKIILNYFKRTIKNYKIKTFLTKKNQKSFFNTILEYKGAELVGGRYLGSNTFKGFPILFYHIDSSKNNMSNIKFYIAYVESGKQCKTLIVENWDNLVKIIPSFCDSGKKYYISLNKKGGEFNENKKNKYGRSRF